MKNEACHISRDIVLPCPTSAPLCSATDGNWNLSLFAWLISVLWRKVELLGQSITVLVPFHPAPNRRGLGMHQGGEKVGSPLVSPSYT